MFSLLLKDLISDFIFDDDSIKNERANMETAFSHHKSMWNFLDAQGQLTPWSVVRSGRNSNSSDILCMSSLPASIKKIGSKTAEKRWRHRFPIISQQGLSVAMEARVLFQSAPKPVQADKCDWPCLQSKACQYLKGSLSWRSLIHTETFRAKWYQWPFTTDFSSSEVSL